MQIRILAINEWGQEAGNSIAVSGRTLPLLQDVNMNGDGRSDTWLAWNAQWRDLVIVDTYNRHVGRQNLSTFDLAVPANYSGLKQALIDTAAMSLYPPTATCLAADVNDDGRVTTADFRVLAQALGSTVTPGAGADLDRDGRVTIRDLVRIRPFLGQECTVSIQAAPAAVIGTTADPGIRADAVDAVLRGPAQAKSIVASRGTLTDRSHPSAASADRSRLLANRRVAIRDRAAVVLEVRSVTGRAE